MRLPCSVKPMLYLNPLDIAVTLGIWRLGGCWVDKDKFAALMPVIVGGLVNKIIQETHVSEDEAFGRLYNSELYAALENEKTKVWTYSVPKLFDLYQDEIRTGVLVLPEY